MGLFLSLLECFTGEYKLRPTSAAANRSARADSINLMEYSKIDSSSDDPVEDSQTERYKEEVLMSMEYAKLMPIAAHKQNKYVQRTHSEVLDR